MNIKIYGVRIVTLIAILSLMGPGTVRAADNDASQPPPNGATTAPSATSPKHHHRHKKVTTVTSAGSKPVASAASAAPPQAEISIGNNTSPDSLGSNSPGSPNMGSPDHTPGTTGTSGE